MKRLSFIIGLILLLVGVPLLLWVQTSLPKPDNTFFWRALYDGGHTPLFGVMALVVLGALRLAGNRLSINMQYGIALLVTTLLGIGIEVSQIGSGRDADPIDVLRDLMGVIAFLTAAALFDSRWSPPVRERLRRHRTGLAAVALILAVVPLLPAVYWAIAEYHRNDQWPLVADFEDPWDRPFFFPSQATISQVPPPNGFDSATGRRVLRVDLDYMFDDDPSIYIREVYPDWRDYDSLLFTIYSDAVEPFQLHFRAHDRMHDYSYPDRYNTEFTIYPGVQHFALPIEPIFDAPTTRRMQPHRMRSIQWFKLPDTPELTFYLDNITVK